jgi:hypothetical protein
MRELIFLRVLKEGHFAWQGRKECEVAVAERTWRCWVEAEKALPRLWRASLSGPDRS